ncbi:S-adenosyl-L-methionine-dependent methyltransferase [Russula vinacea]|nr:S-adenosyl-L-methionine-dependent methyltransferase [Russula vinacea]
MLTALSRKMGKLSFTIYIPRNVPRAAFFLSVSSSDDVDNTRRCSSSRPMSPRVNLSTKKILIIILAQNSGEPSSSPTLGAMALGDILVEKGEEWNDGRIVVRSMGVVVKGDILNGSKGARAQAKGPRIEYRHVMRAVSLRNGLFLIRSIMQSNVRPTSPHSISSSPDKRPRSITPEVALRAVTTRSTAPKRRKKRKHTPPEPGSSEDVISREVVRLLGSELVSRAEADGVDWESPFGFREEVELTVSSISSSGEGLALAPSSKRPWVVVVPFVLPGEVIRARVYRHARMYSFADLISIEVPNSELRDMDRMLSYETQLGLKRNVVVNAYQNYSNIPDSSIPVIQSTILPLSRSTKPDEEEKPSWLKIGFNQIGKRVVMDIEECPIATPVLNEAYGPMRDEIAKKIYSYKKGVSLLLRDSLEIPACAQDHNVCITDHKATVRERVGDLLFDYQAGSFFQNNNSVLVPLTSYVRDAIFPPTASASSTLPPTHLLSADSIRFATHNAALNGLAHKVSFRAGDAAQIFSAVADFPPARTALVVDPPRKGCDEAFIRQLLGFRAQTVVYVSCNVHTQARDIGQIVSWSADEVAGGKGKYVLESLRGFDLFPQTAHVESVAVLRLVL